MRRKINSKTSVSIRTSAQKIHSPSNFIGSLKHTYIHKQTPQCKSHAKVFLRNRTANKNVLQFILDQTKRNHRNIHSRCQIKAQIVKTEDSRSQGYD